MKMKLVRDACGASATLGKLYIDGVFECYTLEDVDRNLTAATPAEKIYGCSAIPRGKYNIIVTPSPHFKRNLPLLLNVPLFDAVRIHSGNTAADTHGCILVGATVINDDFIGQSQVAFGKLFTKICAALDDLTPVELEIV